MIDAVFWEEFQDNPLILSIVCQITVTNLKALQLIKSEYLNWTLFSEGFNYRDKNVFYLTYTREFDKKSQDFKNWIVNFPGSISMIKQNGDGELINVKK